MNQDDLRPLNLNLLVALDALLTERNVTRAALKLGVGQSAMSITLAQLRRHFDDELLVRASDGMRPTPRAFALEEPLRAVLRQIRLLMTPSAEFEAESANRTFRIAIIDGVEMLFLPKLLAFCRERAPGIRLDVTTFDRDRYPLDLDADRLDLAIGFSMAGLGHHKQRQLYRDEYVVIFNRELVDVAEPLKLEDYVRLPHVVTRYRGTPGSAVDDALAAVGKKREIVARTPRFLVVPELVSTSPVLATMGAKLANLCAGRHHIAISAVPLKVAPFAANMVWHTSYDGDPGHKWLRSIFAEIAASLDVDNHAGPEIVQM